ncbi:hypothetical protein DAI22_08g231128 [Oryza sativa Japonica Group]|nr:hypothetical protein DAI22_08g231128 [Oryza sativa Japonica Group]
MARVCDDEDSVRRQRGNNGRGADSSSLLKLRSIATVLSTRKARIPREDIAPPPPAAAETAHFSSSLTPPRVLAGATPHCLRSSASSPEQPRPSSSLPPLRRGRPPSSPPPRPAAGATPRPRRSRRRIVLLPLGSAAGADFGPFSTAGTELDLGPYSTISEQSDNYIEVISLAAVPPRDSPPHATASRAPPLPDRRSPLSSVPPSQGAVSR